MSQRREEGVASDCTCCLEAVLDTDSLPNVVLLLLRS